MFPRLFPRVAAQGQPTDNDYITALQSLDKRVLDGKSLKEQLANMNLKNAVQHERAIQDLLKTLEGQQNGMLETIVEQQRKRDSDIGAKKTHDEIAGVPLFM